MDHGFGAGSAFGANGTPSAVLVDEHGNIASGLAVGAPQVMALANGQAPGMAAPPQLLQPARVGDPAPELKLPDLDGRNFDLAAQRGSEVLVLFWNPGCGFCQQMLPDLKAWEDSRPPGAPELLVVSSGSVADNRAMGLRSRVVLDGGSGVIGGFGANGTPMAVLVDAEGRIASPVAAGAQQVFELANRRRRAAGVGG
jgi:thiol-disulfide isomerase/thioredoxin